MPGPALTGPAANGCAASEAVLIEPAQIQDLPALADLEARCFAVPWTLCQLQSEWRRDGSRFLVARLSAGAAPVGYLSWLCVLDEGQIGNVAVCPDCRGRQVGSALLAACIRQMASDGLTRLTLEVRESNAPAIALYRRAGFVQTGRRPGYYRQPPEAALLMDYNRPDRGVAAERRGG